MARILVIDDEPALRDLLQKSLLSAGHIVTLAQDGEDGLSQILKAAIPVELAIVDIFMPRREGIETLTDLRKRLPHLPLIAISGRPLADEMLKIAAFLGVKATLKKPFSIDHLLKTVQDALPA